MPIPQWFKSLIVYSLVVVLIIFGGLIILSYLQVQSAISTSQPDQISTVNATAISGYTPTPGHSVPQNATAVYLAKPTPYTIWTPYDAQIFIEAMRPKAYTETKNLLISSELGAPGAGWSCIKFSSNIFNIYTVQGDIYCRISLTWTDWQLIVNPEAFIVEVAEGQHVKVLSADGSHYEERALAKVTITIKNVGLNSPGTRFDQRFDFYQDVGGFWSLVIDFKDILLKEDLRQKANELTSDAPDLALADSFAPLVPDGSRSAMYSDQLYNTFVESLTTPGEQHVYNSLLEMAKLVAGFRCPTASTPAPGEAACVNHEFAGLESLTVIVPEKPATPCLYVYASDMKTKVLPEQYCQNTFSPTGIGEGEKTIMASKIDSSALPAGVDYSKLVNKLFSLP